jgi:uncharacterized membrane-anchored protein
MRDHELRRKAVAEMHLRRWPLIESPSTIIQWVLMVADADREAELLAIKAKADDSDSIERPTHLAGTLGADVRFSWERHSEGTSLTLFVSGPVESGFGSLVDDARISSALEWALSLPGEVVRCTRILLVADDAAAAKAMENAEWEQDELVSSYVGTSEMRMWSDFRIKGDGFGRLVVAANATHPSDLTRTLQQLQELGNYRNRALLGLPLARASWPRLNAAESSLRDLANRVARNLETDDQLLDSLSDLSLELASLSTGMRFRMDATKAYARLVEERLEQLRPRPIKGYSSLDDFTQRRFRPAMNTCSASTDRLDELAVRAEQLSSLLRARIETRIENQNAELLVSMERSISLQVRLQQLVEGLSVVALSYYLLALIKLLLEGIAKSMPAIEPTKLIGILVIPVVLAVWLAMVLVKRRLFGAEAEK